MKTFVSLLVLGFVLVIGSLAVTMDHAMRASEATAPPPARPPLTVLSQRWSRLGDSYVQFDGEVMNNTNTPIRHVMAHVTYYQKDRVNRTRERKVS